MVMKVKKVKTKKKETKKLTKKQIIILIIVTIILGILCYFISTEVTKSIIDHKTMAEKRENENYEDIIKIDTITNIDINTFINNYNEISNEDISSSDIVDNVINIGDCEIEFVINDNHLSITSVNFNKKNKSNKEIIRNIIKANNKDIDDDSIDLVYNRVFDNSRIEKIIGQTHYVDIENGLGLCIKTFLSSPRFKDIDWKKQAYWDRMLNEHTPLSEIPDFTHKLQYLLFRYIVSYQTIKEILHFTRKIRDVFSK